MTYCTEDSFSHMLNKISSILSILSFLISITTIGAGYATYKWVSSPQFEAMMLEKIMGSVNKIMPDQIEKKMPKVTGPMLPLWIVGIVKLRNAYD